uniref:Uncharacterized protein n=1 Tax=Timema bartmani TaxID=61472 RepID=A0A7R9F7A6_9NEOP|nr:unnamed protein product [Timema bartmani]
MADSSIVSRPLADLTYKELQNIAMLLSLPANLKRSVMRTLIQARKDGREELVQRLLMTHREQRCRNRPSGSDNRNHRLAPKENYKCVHSKMAEGEYDAEDTISSVIGQAFRTLLHVTGKVTVAKASEFSKGMAHQDWNVT